MYGGPLRYSHCCSWAKIAPRVPSLESKGGRSTNKFSKSQIRKKNVADILQVWLFADLRFADHIFFATCGLRLVDPIIFAHLKLKTQLFSCTFVDLKFANWDTKEVCRFTTWGLIIRNLRICGLAHLNFGFAIAVWSQEFADLRFALTKKNCVPTFLLESSPGRWSILRQAGAQITVNSTTPFLFVCYCFIE
jgi:hypothetical protein